MNDRQRAVERRRLELAARIDVQRFQFRLQSRMLVSGRPWLGLGEGQPWRHHLLLGGLVAACAAALLVRSRLLRSAAPAWQVARLAMRGWVIGKLGWQLARQWRIKAPQNCPDCAKTRSGA